MLRKPKDLDPIWTELHDVEYRVRRIEDQALEVQAEALGVQKASERRLSRRQKLFVRASGLVALVSAVVTIITKLNLIH